MMTFTPSSVVVGVDVHKFSHTAVAMDPWGQEKGRLEFTNDRLAEYAEWLQSFGKKEDILVALEDVNCYGVHLVSALTKEGFAIRYVPAILTERERKQSTKRHKSDVVDATRVGKVMLTKYEQTLPAKESIAGEKELATAHALELMLTERRDLVKGQTILKNQLHALLHQHYGDHYGDEFRKPFHPSSVGQYVERLTAELTMTELSTEKSIMAATIIRRLTRLTLLTEQIKEITKKMTAVAKDSLDVLALSAHIHGCGMVTAATIMAEVATIKRFATEDKFAMYAGVAPTEHSSGSRNRLHTNPFGNRQLNRALHTIALGQIACKGDKQGKEYYAKKLKEGKTKLWALRCLKRQVANNVFRILKTSAAAKLASEAAR